METLYQARKQVRNRVNSSRQKKEKTMMMMTTVPVIVPGMSA